MKYFAVLLSVVCCALCVVAAPPHVLFVVIDDLGWDDVGFRSHEIKTPTIDRLASAGVVLDRYYVQDVWYVVLTGASQG